MEDGPSAIRMGGLLADQEIKSKRKYGRLEKYALIESPVSQARCQ